MPGEYFAQALWTHITLFFELVPSVGAMVSSSSKAALEYRFGPGCWLCMKLVAVCLLFILCSRNGFSEVNGADGGAHLTEISGEQILGISEPGPRHSAHLGMSVAREASLRMNSPLFLYLRENT